MLYKFTKCPCACSIAIFERSSFARQQPQPPAAPARQARPLQRRRQLARPCCAHCSKHAGELQGQLQWVAELGSQHGLSSKPHARHDEPASQLATARPARAVLPRRVCSCRVCECRVRVCGCSLAEAATSFRMAVAITPACDQRPSSALRVHILIHTLLVVRARVKAAIIEQIDKQPGTVEQKSWHAGRKGSQICQTTTFWRTTTCSKQRRSRMTWCFCSRPMVTLCAQCWKSRTPLILSLKTILNCKACQRCRFKVNTAARVRMGEAHDGSVRPCLSAAAHAARCMSYGAVVYCVRDRLPDSAAVV